MRVQLRVRVRLGGRSAHSVVQELVLVDWRDFAPWWMLKNVQRYSLALPTLRHAAVTSAGCKICVYLHISYDCPKILPCLHGATGPILITPAKMAGLFKVPVRRYTSLALGSNASKEDYTTMMIPTPNLQVNLNLSYHQHTTRA